MALQFLPYALAAYGGYKSYKASKDAGVSGIGRLLDTAFGAAAGYYGGQGVLAGGSALKLPGFASAQQNFVPFLQTGPMQSIASNFPALGIKQATEASTTPFIKKSAMFPGEDAMATDSLSALQAAAKTAAAGGGAGGPGGTPADMNALQKLLFRQRIADGKFTGELQIDPFKAAFAIGAGIYLGGAFDPTPTDVYTPGYNTNYLETREKRSFSYI